MIPTRRVGDSQITISAILLMMLVPLGRTALAAQCPSPTTTSREVNAQIHPAPWREISRDLSTATEHRDREALLALVWRLGRLIDRDATVACWWFGMGLTKLALSKGGFVAKGSPYHLLGQSYFEGAIVALSRSIELDPENSDSAAHIVARTTLDPNLRGHAWLADYLDIAIEGLSASPRPDSTDFHLLGRLHARRGDLVEADSLLGRYEASGGHSGAATLEHARIRFQLGAADAADYYYAGARLDDPEGVAAYRDNLSLVATEDELRRFDQVKGDARVEFLHRFWRRRDWEDMREEGERLREHFKRIVYARKHYLLNDPGQTRYYDTYEPYRSGRTDFDDRGVVYVRHGPPDETYTYIGDSACYNQSWLYLRSNGKLVLHFLARTDPSDWRLIESLRNVGGGGFAHIFDDCPGLSIRELAETRKDMDPLYRKWAYGGTTRYWDYQEAELVMPSIRRATTTDSYPRRFDAFLDAVVQLYALAGTEADSGQILIVLAVADTTGGRTLPDSTREYAYRIQLRADRANRDPAPSQEWITRLRAPHPLERGERIAWVDSIAVPTGQVSLGFLIAPLDRRSGLVVTADSLEVPSRDSFAMSDIVLGRPGEALAFQTPLGRFPLNPRNAYAAGDTASIYVEAYRLNRNATYETTITLAERDNPEEPVTTITFEGQARGSMDPQWRNLELRDLDEGDYILTVALQAQGGTLSRWQYIHIVKKER